MLLTGPSGCGKTATVRVLSLEMGLRVQEWISPTNIEAYSSSHGEETSVLTRVSGTVISMKMLPVGVQPSPVLTNANSFNRIISFCLNWNNEERSVFVLLL